MLNTIGRIHMIYSIYLYTGLLGMLNTIGRIQGIGYDVRVSVC